MKVLTIYGRGGHLGHVNQMTRTNFRPPSTQNLALIGHAVSEEKFEDNGHIHVYSPKTGVDNPLESNFYHKYKPLVNLIICCKFLPLNDRL